MMCVQYSYLCVIHGTRISLFHGVITSRMYTQTVRRLSLVYGCIIYSWIKNSTLSVNILRNIQRNYIIYCNFFGNIPNAGSKEGSVIKDVIFFFYSFFKLNCQISPWSLAISGYTNVMQFIYLNLSIFISFLFWKVNLGKEKLVYKLREKIIR